MNFRCCPSYIAVRSLLTGQVVLVTFSWPLIGQLFLAYDVIFRFETCLNLLYTESEARKMLLKLPDQSEVPSYIRRTTPNFHNSYPRISTDNMDVTDCVSSRGSMEYYENRLRTFDTYPKQMLPDKFQLAQTGLYYTG